MNMLFIDCTLLMISAAVLVIGIDYFFSDKEKSNKTRGYVLFYSIFSALWCFSYGLIGFMENLETAAMIRIVGVFAIDGFFVVEGFLVTGMSRINRKLTHGLRTFDIVLAIIDFITFSKLDVNTYVRINNNTLWYSNPERHFERFLHTAVVLFIVIQLFIVGIMWIKNNKYKRQRKFIAMVFGANFLLLFFTIPDTFLPIINRTAIPTSGIGAAACTLVIWYGAVWLNSFDIRMGNIADNIYNFIDAGLMVFDMDYKLAMANPYIKKEFPIEKNNHPELEMFFKISDEEKKAFFEKSLDNIYSARLESKVDQKIYSVRASVAKDDYGEPYCYIFVILDITTEINMVKELEVANNAKTMFLTSISHEIRTPLNAVLGFNDMIIRNTNDPEVLHCADNINQSGKMLLSLINDLLDMGKISSGKMDIMLEEYEVSKLLSDMYVLHVLRAEKKDLTFNFSYDKQIPNILFGDRVRIQQIISNLVSNAIKYTSKGFVSLTFGYAKKSEDEIKLLITVEDTGIGIKKENIPFLYDSFSRFEEQKHRHIEGTGVGLAITKKFLDLMHGTISVTSEYGVGSCFKVVIPQKVVNQEPIGTINVSNSALDDKKSIHFTATGASVLVVDDNKMNLQVFAGMLKHLKMSIDVSESGADALRRIEEKQYDIIFMDHMMPEMDGIETLRRIKAGKNHKNMETPVIVMTANAVIGAREQYLKEGFTDYISKPAELKTLEKMICHYLKPELVQYFDNSQDNDSSQNNDKAQNNDNSKNNDINSQDAKKEEADITLPPVSGVDWSKAFRNIPDRKVLLETVKMFCSSAESEINVLKENYSGIVGEFNEKCLEQYRIKIHSMKNSAALIGADLLSEQAKHLETAAREHELKEIEAHHEEFINDYIAIASKTFESFVKESLIDEKINTYMNDDVLSDKLEELNRAMRELDTITLNDLMLEISDARFSSEQIKKLIKALSDAVRDFDENEFYRIIGDLQQEIVKK